VTGNGHGAAAGDGRGPVAANGGRRTGARGVPWPRVLAFVALLGATVFVANSCQRSQVRIDEQQAIATAREQVDFRPRAEQVRLVRQGLTSRPFWAVSLSVPGGAAGFKELAVVKVDANTGKVVSVATQPSPETPPP
jgi:hypothetical protein